MNEFGALGGRGRIVEILIKRLIKKMYDFEPLAGRSQIVQIFAKSLIRN